SGRQESGRGVVWVQEGSFVRPVPVQVGLSDGTASEVQSDQLKEELKVVVGQEAKEDARSQTAASPFTPQFPGGRQSQSR
ncbi:MAG: RND transporter, partial [Syntrophobacteraceae bacterium]|nr:RND transporter [Syntrophobacteraceae bacterium]